MSDHTRALLEALKHHLWTFRTGGLSQKTFLEFMDAEITQVEASLAEPATPRAKLIRDAKALIRALKLPVGGGVAMNQNDVWCWYKHRPEWNARQMNWEIAGLIHCSPIPVDTLPKWPGSAETSWITLDTPETEASPHPEKGEA